MNRLNSAYKKNRIRVASKNLNLKSAMIYASGLFFLIALMLASTVQNADAALTFSERVRKYNVTGRTGKQVYSKLGKSHAMRVNGRQAIASIRGKMNLDKLKFRIVGHRCTLRKPSIRVRIEYSYPNWVDRRRGSKKMQQLWKQVSRELVRHEQYHGKLYKQTAREIEKKLLQHAKRGLTDCRRLIDRIARDILVIKKRYDRKHVAFDRKEGRPTAKVRKLLKAFALSK